jgi:hypothetical protein
MFLRAYRYSVVEHDPGRPWVVVGDVQHLTVELPDVADFPAWAAEHWPRERFTATLEPGQEPPLLRY